MCVLLIFGTPLHFYIFPNSALLTLWAQAHYCFISRSVLVSLSDLIQWSLQRANTTNRSNGALSLLRQLVLALGSLRRFVCCSRFSVRWAFGGRRGVRSGRRGAHQVSRSHLHTIFAVAGDAATDHKEEVFRSRYRLQDPVRAPSRFRRLWFLSRRYLQCSLEDLELWRPGSYVVFG